MFAPCYSRSPFGEYPPPSMTPSYQSYCPIPRRGHGSQAWLPMTLPFTLAVAQRIKLRQADSLSDSGTGFRRKLAAGIENKPWHIVAPGQVLFE